MMLASLTSSLLLGWPGLSGCLPAGPVFADITAISVQKVGSDGLTKNNLSSATLDNARACLYETRQIKADQTENELLQEVYLLEVRDGSGIRSFELYTAKNLKGNKGKYYQSDCIHDIIGK